MFALPIIFITFAEKNAKGLAGTQSGERSSLPLSIGVKARFIKPLNNLSAHKTIDDSLVCLLQKFCFHALSLAVASLSELLGFSRRTDNALDNFEFCRLNNHIHSELSFAD